jgi:hypothetical protein
MDNRLLSGLLLSALSLACIIIILTGFRKALAASGMDQKQRSSLSAKVFLAVAAWVVLLAILSLAGFFKNFSATPPRPGLVIIVPVFLLLFLSFTRRFSSLIQFVPAHWLVFMQSFRIIVEILLWVAFSKGLLPKQMTFEGRNYDIITGVLALITGVIIMKRVLWWRTAAILFNIVGILLLLNIIVIAVLSMPGPLRYFMNEPSSSIVAEFPFIYLPGILVVCAAALHIWSLRQLLAGVVKPVSPSTPYKFD